MFIYLRKCESLNKSIKCKDGLLLNNENCISCLSLNEGCEKCNELGICSKCFNNKILNYILNNDNKCLNEENKKMKLL